MPIPQGKKRKKNEREIKVEEIQGKTIWEAKT
jgi:putative transposase